MKALHTQLEFELDRFDAGQGSIESLFIGGGTPSTVSPGLYEPIFELILSYLADDAEITTEANPNSASLSWLRGMHQLGVNRVSFGVQSFDASKLKMLNRNHSPSQAQEAIESAHLVGYKHISLDLIYNCQGDDKKLLRHDIQTALSTAVDHISAYELTIENGTRFASTPEVRQENNELAFFVADEIQKGGLKQYEISSFGRYQSSHNRGYWKLSNYIGAGAGAVGFLGDTRYYPVTDIEQYIANPLNITKEPLTQDELLTERIFLGLRSNVGIQKSILPKSMREKAELLVSEKKLTEDEDNFYNIDYFLADEVALFLMG